MHSKICCTFTYQTEISHGTLCEKKELPYIVVDGNFKM